MPSEKTGCIIEMKYAEEGRFDAACKEAMIQIENDGYTDVLQRRFSLQQR